MTKPKSVDEYTTFTNALTRVLKVSHAEMKAKLDSEKRAKTQRKKRLSGHASSDRG
jgi:hypothetical protein